MPRCDGPAGRFKLGEKIIGGFGQNHTIEQLENIWLEDEVLGGKVLLICNQPAYFEASPHFSVSQSEAGFEKIMQAVTIKLTWNASSIAGQVSVELELF